MLADKTILQMKYARIVRLFAERAQLSYEDALGFFYTFPPEKEIVLWINL